MCGPERVTVAGSQWVSVCGSELCSIRSAGVCCEHSLLLGADLGTHPVSLFWLTVDKRARVRALRESTTRRRGVPS